MFKRHPYFFRSILFISIAVLLCFFTTKFQFERRLIVINFVILLAGFILPINYAVACGIITPVATSVLFGVPDVYPQLLLTLCLMISYASFANIFYFSAKWNIYKSLIVTLIMGELVLFSTASILSWVTDGFSAVAYVVQSFIETLPGLILQISLLPLILRVYEHFHNKIPKVAIH